jgi:hypothetical protein
LNANLLKPVDLSPTRESLQFGSIVQVLAADGCLVVSLTVRESEVDCTQEITETCEVTLATTGSACVRNSFQLMNPENFEDCSSFLIFGQNFLLKCVEQPLFLGHSIPIVSIPRSRKYRKFFGIKISELIRLNIDIFDIFEL